MSLSDRLKRARVARGWTQKQLADAVEISVQAISQWENGKTAPHIGRVIAISNLLQVDLDWLMGAEGAGDDLIPASPLQEAFSGKTPIIALQDSVMFRLGLVQSKRAVPNAIGMIERTVDSRFPSFGIIVDDDALEPLFLKNDLLIFETSHTAELGDVVVYFEMLYGGMTDFRIGRIEKSDRPNARASELKIQPFNRAHRPVWGEEHDEWMPTLVTGVLVEFRRFRSDDIRWM